MAKKTWQESLGYNGVKSETSKVNGEDHQFYPISVGMTFELRGLAKPIARAIAGLFGANGKLDTGTTTRNVKNTAEQGSQEIAEYIQSAIDPALAAERNRQMTDAIESLFEAFSEPKTQEIVAKIIMDSLRDVFERIDKPGEPISFNVTPRAFINDTPLPVMKDFVVGVFKANRKVLGPFADLVEAKAAAALTGQESKSKSTPAAPNQTPSESPKPDETPTMPKAENTPVTG